MNKKSALLAAAVAAFLAVTLFLGYERWSDRGSAFRGDALSLVPADASAVIYADLSSLRQSPFLAQMHAWAPHPQTDPEYAQFVRETSFDYERDLDRVVIVTQQRDTGSVLFALADGNFNRAKIEAYADRSGAKEIRDGRVIHMLPVAGSVTRFSFAFLGAHRIALTDSADLASLLAQLRKNGTPPDWRTRLGRVAGAPVFAVIRQDSGTSAALLQQAPGGFRSPQLSALLAQLQWITLAGKPDGDRLRVVAEGECTSEETTRQLSELLNGVIMLAQAGLNDGKSRQQLDPQTREVYLDLLKTADVSRLDRTETKSVRLVFDVTPKFLEAAKIPSVPPPGSKAAPLAQKSAPDKTIKKK